MAIRINPFHELYVGESVGPDKFVGLFSDVLVKHALPLFQPGHVILKGLPGAGKSMLLNLLRPSIRIAYYDAGQPFPVPDGLKRFVGAGINLKRSGISDFGQRPIASHEADLPALPIYFGDFLNYWIVSDIFRSIDKLTSKGLQLGEEIGISYNSKKANDLVSAIAKLDCWSGYLDGIADFASFEKRINDRIRCYRGFLNYNIDALPREVTSTKTLIGVPISQSVQLMKKFELLDQETEVYIRIDQYEELAYLDKSSVGLGTSYQEMIRKLLGMRDSNVSYRIGARNFAWGDDQKMYGTSARLEKKRNYTELSIDTLLKRQENARTWIFPEFAEDIFERRMKLSPYKFRPEKERLLSRVFGVRISPTELARLYVPNTPEKAVVIEDSWPDPWRNFLIKLSQQDPLTARLAEAWARQSGKESIVHQGEYSEPYPWDKKWWRKERTEQALMQIASRNRQQLIWYGRDDILGLSGGHILIFLSICQHVWDVWLRDKRNDIDDSEMLLPQIDYVIQSAGIREASTDWFESISNETGGRERKIFMNFLGAMFYKESVEDKAMSYPGANGFSMTVDDLTKDALINQFIADACSYGDLYDAFHTSKEPNKKPRRKWYLNPILSPHFKIPYAHIKEPMYVKIEDVAQWLVACGVFPRTTFEILLDKKSPSSKLKKGRKKGKGGGESQGAIDFN